MSRQKLTINDWKQRALSAESSIKELQTYLKNKEEIITDQRTKIIYLQNDLDYNKNSNSRIKFNYRKQAKELNGLIKILCFVGEKFPEEEYREYENIDTTNNFTKIPKDTDFSKF